MNMARRSSMRRIRDCLRLYYENNTSQAQISKILGISRSTVQDYLSRLTIASLAYNDIRTLPDADLEQILYRKVPREAKPELSESKEADFNYIRTELAKAGVTLRLLWEEYKKITPDGYQYSQFCFHYQQWRKTLKVYMRQEHLAGEKLYVDYSGKKPFIVNRHTGLIIEVELFVMCWGFSQYIYAEAQEDQKISSWVMGHVHAFIYFDCVSKYIVPDNLKSAVTKAHIYDPDINQSYTDLAEHYNMGILPARPYHPKDKAKVENSVLLVQRWILARLRNQTFHSIDELNRSIRRLLDDLNNRPMQKLHKSRRELFIEVDKPNAQPLPVEHYTFKEWYAPTINLDYHIEIGRRYYSVPWHYYGKKIKACVENGTVAIFYHSTRIAFHDVLDKEYDYSTTPDHMPPRHKAQHDWTIESIFSKARAIGQNTETLIRKIINSKNFPQQGMRPSMGILRLGEKYGNDRLEAASVIALQFGMNRTVQITDLLKNGKDKPLEQSTETVENTQNIRGETYYG